MIRLTAHDISIKEPDQASVRPVWFPCPVTVATEKKSSSLCHGLHKIQLPSKNKKKWARHYDWKLWQEVAPPASFLHFDWPNQCPRPPPHQLCFHPLAAVICQSLLTVCSLKQLWKQVLGPQAASFPQRLPLSHERTWRLLVCQEGRCCSRLNTFSHRLSSCNQFAWRTLSFVSHACFLPLLCNSSYLYTWRRGRTGVTRWYERMTHL